MSLPSVRALATLLLLVGAPRVHAQPGPAWLPQAQERLVGGEAGLPAELPRSAGPSLPARGTPQGQRAAEEAGLLPLEEGVGGAGLPEERQGPSGLGYTPLPARPFEELFVLEAGGGAHLFTGELGRLTGIAGVQLDLGAELRPLSALGVELGYQLSWVGLDPNLSTSGALWRNAFGGLVKAGPALFGQAVRPFVGAGAALAHYGPDRAARAFLREDWVLEVPLAAGLEWQAGPVTLGLRATWRFLLDAQLLATVPPARGPLGGMLGGSALVGGRF